MMEGLTLVFSIVRAVILIHSLGKAINANGLKTHSEDALYLLDHRARTMQHNLKKYLNKCRLRWKMTIKMNPQNWMSTKAN